MQNEQELLWPDQSCATRVIFRPSIQKLVQLSGIYHSFVFFLRLAEPFDCDGKQEVQKRQSDEDNVGDKVGVCYSPPAPQHAFALVLAERLIVFAP